ncbi:MAG TPA: ATP-binding protein [Chitinophagaceae bacterium]|nr:ATP-binding protein [Chitinophagaceae bacterium]
MADMAFDKNNFCWISFPNGIQKFDGKNFTNAPVQPGLPDDKAVKFLRCSNGDLLISHSQGVSKYDINADRFVQVYVNRSGDIAPASFIGQDDNIVYLFSRNGIITSIDCSTFKILSETRTGLPDYSSSSDYRPALSSNIINHRFAIQIKSILYLWDLQKNKLLYQSAAIPDISSFFLLLKSDNEVMYYTYKVNTALYIYNFRYNTITAHAVKGKNNEAIGRCSIVPWRNKKLVSFSNKLYEINEDYSELKSEMVNYQNQPFVTNASIWGIREDNFGNLYLLTVTDGIRKIIGNNYPIKYYGGGKKEDNNVISIFPDKKSNRILTGTWTGLMVFDTLQHLIKFIQTAPGSRLNLSPNTIIKNNKGNYLLFDRNYNSVWELSYDLSTMKPVNHTTTIPATKPNIDYFGNFLYQDNETAFTQSQGSIFKTNLATNAVIQHEFTTSYTLSGLWDNGVILSHTNDELIYLDPATLMELKRIRFENTGGVRCFAKDPAEHIYMGSNKGIFKIDSNGKTLMHLTKENDLPDECIYAMNFDREGFLWCSSNKGIFRVNKNNSILQLKKEDGLQENEFNTNIVAQAEDGELFFGGVNGVSSFYPSAISQFEEKIDVLVTKIKINNEEAFNDTAAWTISDIDLPYHQNSLAFDFVAMSGNNPGQYVYQYKMEGIDDEWIQNNDLQTVRYFLPPRKYVFKIYASRFFDKDAKPIKEIHISIRPPFWKTWWFLTGLAGIFVAAMTYIVNQYNKRKYKKKLVELETEHKVQLERERISRDLHDSIGAYANAVLYNTELLEKEEEERLRLELMKDVKFASKDIITALRETIWALKKDSYNAEDCLVRIRNFIQPFNRYYQHIHFKLEEKQAISKELHYAKALNVVRIAQEAVTNAIKHSGAKSISIVSTSVDGKWELTVSDDGKGFESQTWGGSEQGDGLSNMKKRAADSGFDLRIEQNKPGGTRISLLIS